MARSDGDDNAAPVTVTDRTLTAVGKPKDDGALPASGQLIGRYLILQELGAGGMGTVYLASDGRLDRRIAIKVLTRSRDNKLLDEARALAKLQHPNVVAIYDVDWWQDRVYLAMEYINGVSLADWLTPEVGWRERLSAFEQAGKGLAAAHREGIVHHDVKPSNIMVGNDGRVRLVDFGLARSGDPDVAQGSHGGTPRYMSPEQRRGEHADARTDQFSLCVAMYEALFNAYPFAGETPEERDDAVLAGRVRPPPSKPVPAATRDAILRGLSSNPDDRFATMEAFLAAVTPPRSRRALWLGASAGVVIAIAATGALLARRASDEPAGVPVVTIVETKSPTAASRPAPVQRRLTSSPAERGPDKGVISPDGARLAIIEDSHIVLRDVETGDVHTLTLPHDMIATDASWFPDSNRLLFTGASSAGNSLEIIPISGGAPTRVLETPTPVIAAVSPDGASIAYAGPREVRIRGVDGKNDRLLASVDSTAPMGYADIRWSPDGKHVAWIHYAHQPLQLDVAAAAGGPVTTIVRDVRLSSPIGFAGFTWVGPDRLVFVFNEGRGQTTAPRAAHFMSVRLDANGHAAGDPELVFRVDGDFATHLTATLDGKRVSYVRLTSQVDVYTLDLAKRDAAPRRLTLDDRDDLPGVFTPDSRGIVIASNRRDSMDLYTQALDEEDARPLLVGPDIDTSPRIAPGGADLLFLRTETSSRHLMKMPLAGGSAAQVWRGKIDEAFELECNRTRCVFGHYPEPETLVLRAFEPSTGPGAELMRLDRATRGWALMPDGLGIATSGENVIRVRTFDGKRDQAVPVQFYPQALAVAPDGRTIYVTGLAGGAEPYQVVRVDLSGRMKTLASSPSSWLTRPIVSPDGKHLAYAAMGMDTDLWIVEGL